MTDLYREGLKVIVQNPGLLQGLPLMPNVELRVLDAGIWWTNLAAVDGWKLQQNSVTGHCRILDPDRVRRAWGGVAEVQKAFRTLVGKTKDEAASAIDPKAVPKLLAELAELRDKGIVTNQQFEEKRKKLLDMI